MRARITQITTHTPTKRLRTSGGDQFVVTRTMEMDLSVISEVTPEEFGRLDVQAEIILAAIPQRKTDGLTEGALAAWADLLSSRAGLTPESEETRAIRLLLPEVVALRREVASLGAAVETWRNDPKTAQSTVEKMREALDAVATHCAAVADAGAGFDVEYLRRVAERAGGTAEDLLED